MSDLIFVCLDIQQLAGYSKRYLIRLSKELINEKGMEDILHHANEVRIPVNKASTDEIDFICTFKVPYPNITIAHIYLEDIIYNSEFKENIKLRINIFINEMYIIRHGKKYQVLLVSERIRKQKDILNNQKDILKYLEILRANHSSRKR